MSSLLVARLGLVDYREAWDLQKGLAAARRLDRIPDTLVLLQHPHIYTLGRRGTMENVLLTPRQLGRRGIALYEVDRGGDVTYHGPGQLVGYPILRRSPGRLDFLAYIRSLERALLAAVRALGVPGERQDGFSGVWVGNDKLCAIGVKVDAYGVTSHGFALNVSTDLSYFDHIIPCGIKGRGVTSLERLLGRRVSMRRVEDAVFHSIALEFGLEALPRAIGRARLERLILPTIPAVVSTSPRPY